MKKNVIRINESQLKSLIAGIIKESIYNFASEKPQYDINSDEWNQHYTEMDRDAAGRNRADNEKIMNQQIRHHFGEKGNAEGAEFEYGLDRDVRLGGQRKKEEAMSPETIETEVMRALNNGKDPESIINLKPFSPEEKTYIKDDCVEWLEPIGTIDNAGKIVFYNTKENKFVSYDDDREY